MKISFKKRLLSLLTVTALTIPLLPQIPIKQVFAWTPSFTNRDPGAYGNNVSGMYPTVNPGAKSVNRITFVDSVTGESVCVTFFCNRCRNAAIWR